MKTKGLFLVLMLVSLISFGQTVESVFKSAFPEVTGDLKIDSTTTYDKSKLKAYRNLYYKLAKGLDDVKAFEVGAATEEIMQVFEFKSVKKLEKENKLDSLKMVIRQEQKKIQDLLKWYEPLAADTMKGIQADMAYRSFLKNKQYKEAYPTWSFLYREYPLLNKLIYAYGNRVLKTKIKSAKSEEEKNAYLDTLFDVYEKFFELIPKFYKPEQVDYKKSYYMGLYAKDLYDFKINGQNLNSDTTKDYIRKTYKVAMDAIKYGKEKTKYFVFPIAMKMTFFLYQMKELTEEQALDNYMTYSDYLRIQYDNEKDPKKKERIKKNGIGPVDLIFSKSEISTCPNLCKAFGQQYEDKKNDPDFLRKILSILASRPSEEGCTDSAIFANAAVQLYSLEPSADAAHRLGMLFASKEDFEKAAQYYEDAIKLSTDPDSIKAAYYFDAAKIYRKLHQYSKAREYALKATSLKSNFGEPYILIAMMYAETAGSCGKSKFEHKAVYWAAVDKLVKAKSIDPSVAEQADELIRQYSARYPDKNDGFMNGAYEGNSYKIEGCWINETTTVRYNK